MTINYKKVGIIFIFLAITIVIAYFLYALFLKPATNPEPAPNIINQTGNGLPIANPGSPSGSISTGGQLPNQGSQTIPNNDNEQTSETNTVISQQAAFATLGQNGAPQFYNQTDSRFYTIDPAGNLVTLSNKQFFGVKQVTWAPNSQKAILEYPDGSNIRYDFSRDNQVTLPQHWEDFNFSTSGDEIVAKSIGLDPNNRWLVVANEDGSKARTIEPLGENGDKVISSWSPNNQSIAFFVDGVDFNRKEVFFVGQNGENFKSMITEGRGFQPLWAPTGNQLVYSVYSADNDFKPSLWVVDAQGDTIGANRRPLNLETWANKCSFSQTDLYCAVPLTLERGAGMFPALANNSSDLLYKINITTGQREQIQLPTNSSISNLSLSADGTYLYYIENGTNYLRKIKIR